MHEIFGIRNQLFRYRFSINGQHTSVSLQLNKHSVIWNICYCNLNFNALFVVLNGTNNVFFVKFERNLLNIFKWKL